MKAEPRAVKHPDTCRSNKTTVRRQFVPSSKANIDYSVDDPIFVADSSFEQLDTEAAVRLMNSEIRKLRKQLLDKEQARAQEIQHIKVSMSELGAQLDREKQMTVYLTHRNEELELENKRLHRQLRQCKDTNFESPDLQIKRPDLTDKQMSYPKGDCEQQSSIDTVLLRGGVAEQLRRLKSRVASMKKQPKKEITGRPSRLDISVPEDRKDHTALLQEKISSLDRQIRTSRERLNTMRSHLQH